MFPLAVQIALAAKLEPETGDFPHLAYLITLLVFYSGYVLQCLLARMITPVTVFELEGYCIQTFLVVTLYYHRMLMYRPLLTAEMILYAALLAYEFTTPTNLMHQWVFFVCATSHLRFLVGCVQRLSPFAATWCWKVVLVVQWTGVVLLPVLDLCREDLSSGIFGAPLDLVLIASLPFLFPTSDWSTLSPKQLEESTSLPFGPVATWVKALGKMVARRIN